MSKEDENWITNLKAIFDEQNKELAKVKKQLAIVEQRYAKAKWWLNEIVTNHRFTPISTAEKAIKDLDNEPNE